MRFYLAGVPAPPLRRPGARDHRGAAGILGDCQRDRARRRHCRRRLSVLIVPPFLIFCHRPRAGCTRLQRHEIGMTRHQEPGNSAKHVRPSPRSGAGEARRRVVAGCLRARRRIRGAGARCPAPVQNPPESPGAAAINQPAPPDAFKPGFIDAVGRWLEEGAQPSSSRTCRARRRSSTSSATRPATPPRRRPAPSSDCPMRGWWPGVSVAQPRRAAGPIARRRPIRSAAARASRAAGASTPSPSRNARRNSCSKGAPRTRRNADHDFRHARDVPVIPCRMR